MTFVENETNARYFWVDLSPQHQKYIIFTPNFCHFNVHFLRIESYSDGCSKFQCWGKKQQMRQAFSNQWSLLPAALWACDEPILYASRENSLLTSSIGLIRHVEHDVDTHMPIYKCIYCRVDWCIYVCIPTCSVTRRKVKGATRYICMWLIGCHCGAKTRDVDKRETCAMKIATRRTLSISHAGSFFVKFVHCRTDEVFAWL